MGHDEEIARLVSLVSHDLRSPLTAIMLGSRLLAREPALHDTGRQVASEMVDAAEELQRRIFDWLDVTRAQHGGLALQIAAVDLADLARGAQRDADRRTRLRGQSLSLVAQPALVRADHRILPRLILALLDHALQNSPEGSQIALEVGPRDGGGAVRAVDQGAPFTDEHRKALFELFPDNVGGRHVGGIGLGLLRIAAEAMGGRVWAEDGGRGGALVLWLPPAS